LRTSTQYFDDQQMGVLVAKPYLTA